MGEQNQNNNEQLNGQQPEKLFTQDDVNRIVGERLARVKMENDSAETYKRERDEARRELEQYKNESFLMGMGVKQDDLDYVLFKVGQKVDDKTDFKKAADAFLKENPRYTGKGFKVSTGTADGGSGSSGSDSDAAIRKAMGLRESKG